MLLKQKMQRCIGNYDVVCTMMWFGQYAVFHQNEATNAIQDTKIKSPGQ